MRWFFSLVSCVLVASVLMACGGTTPPSPMEPAPSATAIDTVLAGSPPAIITGIVWQWETLAETARGAQSSVPDPHNYTLIFWPNGMYQVVADCNSGSGAYALEGKQLTLELGPMTIAACPPESLSDLYLQMLGRVVGYDVQDGRLVLALAGNSGELTFGNAGPAEAAVNAEGVGIDPASVALDTQGLPYSSEAHLIPATRYDASQPPGPVGLPEHIQIGFGPSPTQPVLYIIPVEAYDQLWVSNGDPSVSRAIEHLGTLLAIRPSPIPPFGLPALPFEQVGAGVNDLAVQGKYLDFDSGYGLRFVGRFTQDPTAVTNMDLRYIFQGFSGDGRYLITFFCPVTSSALPDPEEVSATEQEGVNSDPVGYLERKAQELEGLGSSDWEPDLATLDALVASLRFEAAPTGGQSPEHITNIVWQWAGLVQAEPTGQSVVPDPASYTLVFRRDGLLELNADCNVGRGSYSLEGGQLTLELGALTRAFCGEDSLSDPYLQLLSQVTSYRLEDGWLALHLAGDGGRMIFSNGGPAE